MIKFDKTIVVGFLSCLFLGCGLQAQQNISLEEEIPVDPSVLTGELDNGINFYIRKNTKSENKAELRLVLNAGSVLETEKQQGLAHFIEHMAFNGTTHFEKNELIDYLQNLGVEFGADLNAHTGFDETVYKLTIPTDDKKIFNDGLQILRDWADGITLSETEIDNERGVVAEELRSGLSAYRRMFNEYVPILTNESRYAERLPIGKLDVILNADYEELRKFYKDWYRPDLMAVVIVGDVDPEKTEAMIREYFEGVEPHEDPKERTEYSIPDNKETKVAVVSDVEADAVSFYAYYKKDKQASKDLADYREDLLERLYSSMLNQRLDELIEEGKAPFLSGGAGLGNFLGDKDAYFFGGALKEEKIKEGIRSLLVESERARRYGFTKGELERHKQKLLNTADLRRKEDGKMHSRNYVELYIDHFMSDLPIPSNEFTYQFYKEQLPGISLEEVNGVAEKWIQEENRTLVLTAPEKEELDLPSEKELIALFDSVEKQELEAYEDKLEVNRIMEEIPEPGKIVDSKYIEAIDVTELLLSNGVKVVLKPTDFQNDIVNMSGFREGGSSLAPDSIYVSARQASGIIGQSGVNGISSSDLSKLTMGKTVSVRPFINFYEELVNGGSSSADLETLLQLTNLYFTAPNKDPNVFKASKDKLVAGSKNADSDPNRYYYGEIAKEISNNHLRAVPVTTEQYKEELDLDVMYDFYKERFSSADDFTFLFVGSFEVDSIKPLIETYIGSLPGKEIKTGWKDIGLRYAEGGINKKYYKGKEDKSSVSMRYTGDLDHSLYSENLIDALERLLRLKLYEELREKMGGVYGVRVSGYATDTPYDWYRLGLEFSCAPENVDKLVKATHEEIQKIKEDGVSNEDLTKIKEAIRLNTEEGLNYNGYWSAKLKEAYTNGSDPVEILNYEEFIDNLTAEDLQEAAKKYLVEEHYTQFVLYPEEEK